MTLCQSRFPSPSMGAASISAPCVQSGLGLDRKARQGQAADAQCPVQSISTSEQAEQRGCASVSRTAALVPTLACRKTGLSPELPRLLQCRWLGRGVTEWTVPRERAPALAGSLTPAAEWWPLAWPAEAAPFHTEGQSCPDQSLGRRVPRLARFVAQRPARPLTAFFGPNKIMQMKTLVS